MPISAELVQSLLQEQHADLADLPLLAVDAGWDNQVYRLGGSLAVRMPRRQAAAELVEREQRWLPTLAPRLPLPIPAPVRHGRPGCGFPWRWSVVPWLDGEAAFDDSLPVDWRSAAAVLGGFVSALHAPTPSDAPWNPWRSIPLVDRTPLLERHLDRLGDMLDVANVAAAWDGIVADASHREAPVWIHGDLHPGNILVDDRARLSGVLDFGDLAAGDRATDLAVAWLWLPAEHRSTFREAAGSVSPIDDGTWNRARGWALALALALLAHSGDDVRHRQVGLRAVREVLGVP